MVPMVARATQEVLALVPGGLREASLALGVSRWRTVFGVVLPTAIGGIVTGTVLAIARVAGETAPLLFTSSITANAINFDVHEALPTIPVAIFAYSELPDPAEQALAWTAALVLITFVLIASVVARASRRAHAAAHRRSLDAFRQVLSRAAWSASGAPRRPSRRSLPPARRRSRRRPGAA